MLIFPKYEFGEIKANKSGQRGEITGRSKRDNGWEYNVLFKNSFIVLTEAELDLYNEVKYANHR